MRAAREHFLGGDEREALGEIEADVATEDAERAGAGPVGAGDACARDVSEEVLARGGD